MALIATLVVWLLFLGVSLSQKETIRGHSSYPKNVLVMFGVGALMILGAFVTLPSTP